MRVIFGAVLPAILFSAVLSFAQSPDIASLKSKAEAGDTAAQVALGRAYEKGEGLAQNDDLAVKWYRAAAEKGSPQAQSELGVMYRLGRGVPQDKEEAVKWYRLAAKQGYGPAMFNLGTCYYNGDGVGISDADAYAWFIFAQRAGSKDAADAVVRLESELSAGRLRGAKLLLASMALSGKQVPSDPGIGLGIRKTLADAGDSEAQFLIGRMYAEGVGVAPNPAMAVHYLSECKFVDAQLYLASLYLEGKHGVNRDSETAVKLLTNAGELWPQVKLRLGLMYWGGNLIPQDDKKAVKVFESLAKLNDPKSLLMLGDAYSQGRGVKRDQDTSCFYYALASVRGLGVASCSQNPEKMKKRIVEWLRTHPARIDATLPMSSGGLVEHPEGRVP